MGEITFLMYAHIVLWTGLFLYLVSLTARQRRLERHLEDLEAGCLEEEFIDKLS